MITGIKKFRTVTGTAGTRSAGAFSLIEMLVVISIIAVVSGLIVSGTRRATNTKNISRVQGEMALLVTAINAYKAKYNQFPPDNPAGPITNQLFYELTGTVLSGTNFSTLDGKETIGVGNVNAFFGADGFLNVTANPTDPDSSKAKDFLGALPSQYGQINNNPDVELLRVPVKGPWMITNAISGGGFDVINPWRYVSTNPTNNRKSFDLWAEIKVGDKIYIINNWSKTYKVVDSN